MYTANKKNGVGEIIETKGNKVVVYFEDTDTEKTLISDFVTIFETYEDAENSIEDTCEVDNSSDLSVFHKIEETNKEASRKLMSVR